MLIQLFWQLLITLGYLFNEGQGANAHGVTELLPLATSTAVALLGQEIHEVCPSPGAGAAQLWALISDGIVRERTGAGCPLLQRPHLCQLGHRQFPALAAPTLAGKSFDLVVRKAFPLGKPW